ncbi:MULTISPECIES: sensor histidine kinase [Cyanophyceae]|uniref:sensor histidine kinase n=1 Tax=Cyanophyceae TaxID=3028117 RepID=UPI0016860D67|nr:ATP-binding protein [Trichocoleus sp. FACHB-40]MBD2002356.1 hypothetical protein [Trichocoleus sp. FACHB-40]
MWELLKELFSSTQFIPHGHCYLWQTKLVWLHLLSDLFIAIAYFSIPAMLLYFIHERQDIPFQGIFALFGAFIILCGTGHLMEIWTLWHPTYWLTGVEQAITALVSCYTALQMVTLLPQFLALKTPEQLEAVNRELQSEIAERQRAEEALRNAYDDLEIRVSDRTAELSKTLSILQTEMAERKQAEAALQESEAREREKSQELEIALHELKSAQVQLVQKEKMASLGQLAAGIAHEINNPTSFIYGNVTPAIEYASNLLKIISLYQSHYPQPSNEIQNEIAVLDLDFLKRDFLKLLWSMRTGATRIKEIVASMRNFSRLDEAEIKEADLHSGIESTLMILQNRLKEQPNRPAIEVIKEFDKLPLVACYPGQLNQVFMNILNNAIDALEEKINEGYLFTPQIRIATEVRYPEETNFKSLIPNSQLIVIRITDNGKGITPYVKEHLFDPFFTTKPVGKGTGLGLSISYQIIVEKHQGRLKCNSQLGEGAEFAIEINAKARVNAAPRFAPALVEVHDNAIFQS